MTHDSGHPDYSPNCHHKWLCLVFRGIWEIFPQMFWEHTAFVPTVIHYLGQAMVLGMFLGKGRGVEKEQRGETFQNLSPPVTTKTTKNSLVMLSLPLRPFPPFSLSFIPPFLPFHLLSPCILPFSTSTDWDQMWWMWLWRGGTVDFVIRREEAETTRCMVLLPPQFLGFSFQTSCGSGYRQCS